MDAPLDVNGTKVGVIGYITTDRRVYDGKNIANITFMDEVESIRAEAKMLKDQGVDIIIAAGHSGKNQNLSRKGLQIWKCPISKSFFTIKGWTFTQLVSTVRWHSQSL